MLRPVQAARTLSAAGLSGINLYAPKELIISAWAGTPLPEIEAALAEPGQHLIAEPPDLSGLLGATGKPQTLGGVVATNLSGPRRVAWGAMRDHVMGVRAVTGRAEVIHSGGRVLKNVTGLDLCKLLTGSHGTLGVITEITLKVLPAPEATGTLVLPGLDAAAGVAALSAALGSPFGVSGAAWLPADAVARVPGLDAVRRIGHADPDRGFLAVGRLPHRPAEGQFAVAGAVMLDTAASRALWKDVRDARPLDRRRRRTRSGAFRSGRRPGPSVLTALATGWRHRLSRLGRRPGLAGRSAPMPPPMRRWRLPRVPPAVTGPCCGRPTRCAARCAWCPRGRAAGADHPAGEGGDGPGRHPQSRPDLRGL